MSKAKPWKIYDNGDGTHCISAGGGDDICHTCAASDEPKRAALLSAAPSLLDACRLATPLLVALERMVECAPDGEYVPSALTNIDAVIVAIRDAVAAATGGKP